MINFVLFVDVFVVFASPCHVNCFRDRNTVFRLFLL